MSDRIRKPTEREELLAYRRAAERVRAALAARDSGNLTVQFEMMQEALRELMEVERSE